MEKTPSSFIPGVILGIGIGLLLGHLSFGKSKIRESREKPAQFASAYSPYLPSSLSISQTNESLYDFHWNPGPDGDSVELKPLQNALAVNTTIDPHDPKDHSPKGLKEPKEIVPASQPALLSEPQQLPPAKAAPLAGNSPEQRQMIRDLIDLEMSQHSPEQRQAWYESLKDVEKQDVVGILKMWRMVGSGEPGFAPFGAAPPALSTPKPVAEMPGARPVQNPALKESGPTLEQRQAVAEVHRMNALMECTPGYLPMIPHWELKTGSDGEKSFDLQIRPDVVATKMVETGFPLDVAIKGPGFFLVQGPDRTNYCTRNGNFDLDEENRLGLTIAGVRYTLLPEVRLDEVDENIHDVRIHFDGSVNLIRDEEVVSQIGQITLVVPLTQKALTHVGNGLFRLPPPDTKSVTSVMPSKNLKSSTLNPRSLLFPVIDVARESKLWEKMAPGE